MLAPFVLLLLAPSASTASSATTTTTLVAQDVAQAGYERGYSGNFDFSFANATGNTENMTLILRGRLESRGRIVNHKFEAGARYAESGPPDGERSQTQEAAFASYQLDATIADKAYAYGRTRYDYDAFSGFEQRVFVGGGFGYRFYEREDLNWNIEIGPGVRWTEYDEATMPADMRMNEAEFSLYASSDFAWDVNDAVGIEQDSRITYTDISATFESEFSLTSKLTEKLSARASYLVRHETNPPANREPTDTLLSAGISLGF
ncbi:DUF481 domain-containing protein [Parvularcula dongshanensis]|uniref:Putative salt-induced outer membrane protein n=1 Tax=Parvularcula dongshanensis TaxID=1173995 RepID=A0A840I0D1_9PROT|nr:DUF481 domain-containing protein [Parvularcula dongshanensis]MBB4657704.1 putative salt-induced outer membrane protein [Parvularcula dongshanensis]